MRELQREFPKSQVQGVSCVSDDLTINQRFPPPTPWVQLIHQHGSQKSEKHLSYLIYYKLLQKGYNLRATRWKRSIEQGMGKDALSELTTNPEAPRIHQPGTHPFGFLQRLYYIRTVH